MRKRQISPTHRVSYLLVKIGWTWTVRLSGLRRIFATESTWAWLAPGGEMKSARATAFVLKLKPEFHFWLWKGHLSTLVSLVRIL